MYKILDITNGEYCEIICQPYYNGFCVLINNTNTFGNSYFSKLGKPTYENLVILLNSIIYKKFIESYK